MKQLQSNCILFLIHVVNKAFKKYLTTYLYNCILSFLKIPTSKRTYIHCSLTQKINLYKAEFCTKYVGILSLIQFFSAKLWDYYINQILKRIKGIDSIPC